MRRSLLFIVLSLLFWLQTARQATAQNYFKLLEASNLYFNQQISRFSNGDILICDSSIESLQTGGTNGKVVLIRLDECGAVNWSFGYTIPQGYLEFKDFKINAANEVFVYGSYFEGLSELIFLLKINGDSGEIIAFRLFNPSTVDHFSYTLDLKGGELMIYGLLLDFSTQKEGFVAIFDENLNFKWAKKFAPFESTGAAIINRNNGFTGWSGNFLLQLSSEGKADWAVRFSAGSGGKIIGGPVEVSDGYLWEAHESGSSFFFKLDAAGQLVWQSDRFTATDHPSALTVLPDKQVWCSYVRPDHDFTQLSMLSLSSSGNISGQVRLVLDQSMKTGSLFHSLDNNIITIAGNADPAAGTTADIADFIMQFSLADLSEGCGSWESFEDITPNGLILTFDAYQPEPEAFQMELVRKLNSENLPFVFPLREICDEPIDPELLTLDTFLQCGENWLAFLPGPDYEWVDNYTENPRLINDPGVYKARKKSCTNPIVVSYQLQKPNCGCPVYLPNAFSPNSDGNNDFLEFFSGCSLQKIEMSIFNRWGQLLFRSRAPGQFWDGTFQQRPLPPDVYMVMVKYEYVDLNGMEHTELLTKDITLIR